MSYFYIEPQYNSGERVSGGKLAIYESQSSQHLCDLYRVADFGDTASPADYLLPNPLPIDSNGINSAPVFIDLDLYSEAYYRVYDARGAEIRSGYVIPLSWHGGGAPPAGNKDPFANVPAGDPFWGYQAVSLSGSSFSNLSEFDGSIGRPLFLAGQGAADKSGGVVIWCPSGGSAGSADNVLSFAGKNGSLWRAREEFINYSYLKNSGKNNPFLYIDGINQANGWDYGIRLDAISTFGALLAFEYKGKVLIDSKISATMQGNRTTVYMAAGNLAITCDNPFTVDQSYGFNTLSFNVGSGSFFLSQILDSAGRNFVKGTLDSVVVNSSPSSAINITDLTIKKLVSSTGGSFGGASIAVSNGAIEEIDNNIIPNNVSASLLKNWGVLRYNALFSRSINLDADINFDVVGAGVVQLSSLSSSGNAYFIKPSPNFVFDNTFYAKNADFYDTASPASSVTAANRHYIGNYCRGHIRIRPILSDLIYLDDPGIDLSVDAEYYPYASPKTIVWLNGKAGSIRNLEVNLDMGGNITQRYFMLEAFDCNLNIANGNLPAWSSQTAFIQNSKITKSIINPYAQRFMLANSSAESCRFYDRMTGGNPGDINWNSFLILSDNAKAVDCEFSNVSIGFRSVTEGGIGYLKNIEVKNCRATNDNVYIVMPDANNEIDPRNYWRFEGVRIVDNMPDRNGYRFIPVCNPFAGDGSDDGTGTSSSDKWMRGHIEITGKYSMSKIVGQIATTEFPDLQSGVGTNWPVSISDDGVSNLCMKVFGDPLKYTDKNLGIFMALDPWIQLTDVSIEGIAATNKYYSNDFPVPRLNYTDGNGVVRTRPVYNAGVWPHFYRIRE